jgi:hypothetical protein
VAVIIGSAINSSSDYGSDVTNRYLANQSFTDAGAAYGGEALGPYDYPYGQHAAQTNNITGAVNYNASSSYFYDILMKLSSNMGLTNPTEFANYPGQSFTQEYNGSVYYIYICSTPRTWTHYSGVYTVPAGQGTTVFGFVGVRANAGNGGNALDNILFASGSPLTLSPTINYGNEVTLSVPTKSDYVYGIAEVRGSSVSLVADAVAYYDPDGAGASSEVAISTTAGLGIGGWYSTYGANVPFNNNGVITFKNLTPGKTYRIVGIPRLAVNTGLHVNETPEYVLDEGYYQDIQTPPAYEGSSTIVWNVDVDTYMDGATERARVIVKNARNDVEYALLADDGTGHPDVSKPAHFRTDWVPGMSGFATFDSLALDSYYYLVARPYGYDEITYAEAAYNADGTTPAYIRIKTPGAAIEDIDKADVSRSTDCLTLTLTNSKSGYVYALVDPETGVIIGSTQNGNGGTLNFALPDASKTYQIVTKSGDANWFRGVRVYGCPDDFFIDYPNETVKSSHDASGNIPTDIEYHIRSNNISNTWILFDANTWTAGIGTQPVNLSTKILSANTQSILDSITALTIDATLYYRVKADNSYTGQSVGSIKEIVIPKRPDAPSAPVNYVFDFVNEKITAVSDSLHFAQISVSQWTKVLSGASWTFADAGWGEGASKRPFNVRIPATATSFASSIRTDTIPARPPAPNVGLNSNNNIDKVVISNMISGVTYQYYTSLNSNWVTYTPTGTESDSITFAPNSFCYVRLAATNTAPASFTTVLTSPISIQPVHFANYAYGATPVSETVVVLNTVSLPVDIVSIELDGVNSQYFHFQSEPSTTADRQVPANGTNTNWVLIPNSNLNAGTYNTQLKMTYTYNSTQYVAYAGVYLTVDRANWNMSNITGVFDVTQTKAQQLVLNVSNAPSGATLSYYYGSTQVTGNPSTTVASNGTTSYTFTSANGLQPSTTYPVSVIAEEDANHYASPLTVLANGYTAYATPVFNDVITIDYINERLTFKTGYSNGDYTLSCSSCSGSPVITSPYSLYSLLEDVNNSSMTFSIVHNAGLIPPYPASEPGFSNNISGRGNAPEVDSVAPATTCTFDDGNISVTGQFEYRIHGTTVWSTASTRVSGLVSGDYDVRRPAVANTSFASRWMMVAVPANFCVKDDNLPTSCDAMPLTIDVLANDDLPTGCTAPIVTIVSKPAHVIATVDANNNIIYTGDRAGTDTIIYSVTCGTDVMEAKVYVTMGAIGSAFVDDIWYFGQNVAGTPPTHKSPGIRFVQDGSGNYVAQDASGESNVKTVENTLVISSPYCDGQNIFYSSHNQLYNSLHDNMQNGSFSGDESVADGLAACYMGDNKYLFFTVTANYLSPRGLSAYIVDMNGDNGKGERINSTITVEPPHINMSETVELTARAGTTHQYWLIYAHRNSGTSSDAYSNELRVRLIDVSDPDNPSIGGIHSSIGKANSQTYTMKISHQYNRIAITNNHDYSVDIFDFDNSTGILSNRRNIKEASAGGRIHGLEFSPDGNQLYYAGYNDGTQLYQYDVSGTPVQNTGSPITYWASGGGGLKLGPDGKIYVLTSGSNTVGAISDPNSTTSLANRYSNSALTLSVNYNGIAFSTGLTKPAVMTCNINNPPTTQNDDATFCISSISRTVTVNVLENDADVDNNTVYLTSAEFVNPADTALADITVNAADSTITLTLKTGVTLPSEYVFEIIYNVKDNGLPASQCATGMLGIMAIPSFVAADITAKDTSICSGTGATLNVSSSVPSPTFLWYASQTATAPFHTGDSYTTSILSADSTFYVSISGGSYCENATVDRKAVKVTVNQLPTVSISMPELCPELTATLTPGIRGGLWTNSDPSTVELTDNRYVKGIKAGTVTLTFTDSTTGCSNKMTLTVYDFPTVDETQGKSAVCQGDTVHLSNATPGGVWTTGNYKPKVTIDDPNANPVIVRGVATGDTYVTYTVSNSNSICQTKKTFRLKVVPNEAPKVIIGIERK